MLIHSGSGGVGGFAVQFTKAIGAYVYATASGDAIEVTRDYGADEVTITSRGGSRMWRRRSIWCST